MSFTSFVSDSGLKVLAMARLSQYEYSILYYLLNCSASGMDQLVTTKKELGSLIGYDEETIDQSLTSLAERNMIDLHFGDAHHPADRRSLRVGLQYDISQWQISHDQEVTSKDAIVFPFRRDSGLQLINAPESAEKPSIKHPAPTWKRIVDTYAEGRDLSTEEYERAKRDAQILIDTHPVDQVLLVLRHFGDRIPTLSLLASSWQHFQTQFEEETEKVDLNEARHKHHELDHRLRDAVDVLLKQKTSLDLNDEEVTVLEILYKHRHPRRQLFWAYQTRSRYPNLKSFFDDNSYLMLPVTSNGTIVKKKPHLD
jgi:hypothetical protein